MYGPDVVAEELQSAAAGEPTAAIARRLGVSRSTVRSWMSADMSGLDPLVRATDACRARCDPTHRPGNDAAYAYLLGQYLGDGCISAMGNSFRLRLTCCTAYPLIMDECVAAIVAVRPGARPHRVARAGCTEIYDSWRHWPCVLPHGSGGVKHLRPIELEPWQQRIALDIAPGAFVRGLVHSDGWRGTNRVRGANGQTYEYTRYQFSNRSDDIRDLFVAGCQRLGVETRPMNRWNIAVSKRSSVERLDRFVGPKR